MDSFMNAAAVQRFERYFQQIGDVLGEERQHGSFALYASEGGGRHKQLTSY